MSDTAQQWDIYTAVIAKQRAQIKRQRIELRRLNKAHAILWKVVAIRSCSYCHPSQHGRSNPETK